MATYEGPLVAGLAGGSSKNIVFDPPIQQPSRNDLTISSGLQTANLTIKTGFAFLDYVILIPAGGDATLTIYDNTSAAGVVLARLRSLINISSQLNFNNPIGASIGLHVVVEGSQSAYVIGYR